MIDAGRPQDQERPHRRRSRQSPETRSLLVEYRTAMRAELRATLAELRPRPPLPGLLDGDPVIPYVPASVPIADRIRLWDLAIKLGRELGAEVDEPPAAADAGSAKPPRRGRVDFGGR